MKNYFLDKKFPPEHSFVDGLIEHSPKDELTIYCEFTKNAKLSENYRGVKVRNILLPRVGVFRILSLIYTPLLFTWLIMKREKFFFTRNDPILLMSASILKLIKSDIKLIYQNSFPHDDYQPKSIKSRLSRLITKLTINNVDKVIVVSDLAKVRLEKIFHGNIMVIPLCVSDSLISLGRAYERSQTNDSVLNLVYLGSHEEDRELSFILESILIGNDNLVHMYGNSFHEEEKIRANLSDDVNNRVLFYGKYNRDDLFTRVVEYDYGLCIIPPKPYFLEASPTKLTEYMALGLPVIINEEIKTHQDFFHVPGFIVSKYTNQSIRKISTYLNKNSRSENKNKIIEHVRDRYNYSKFIGSIWHLND